MAVLEKLREQNNPYNSRLRMEMGFMDKHLGMTELGFQESLGATAWASWKKFGARRDAEKAGEEPLSRAQFDINYGANTDFEYKEGEYAAETELRFQYELKRKIAARKTMGINPVTGFIAGSAGNMANPLDMALAFVPYAGIGKFASATVAGVRAGKTVNQMSRTMKLLRATTKQTRLGATVRGAFRNVKDPEQLKSLSFGKTFTTLAKAGLTEQVIENGAVYVGSQYTGRDYGALDFVADTIFGGAFHSAAAGHATLKLQNAARTHKQMVTDRNVIRTALEQGNIGKALNILSSYDGRVSDALGSDPEVARVLNLPESEALKPENRDVLDRFLVDNIDAIWFQNLKGVILTRSLDENKDTMSMLEKRIYEQAQMETIVQAVKEGRISDLPADLQEKISFADSELIAKVQRILESRGEAPKKVAGTPTQSTANPLLDRILAGEKAKPEREAAKARIESLEKSIAETEAELNSGAISPEQEAALQEELQNLTRSLAQSQAEFKALPKAAAPSVMASERAQARQNEPAPADAAEKVEQAATEMEQEFDKSQDQQNQQTQAEETQRSKEVADRAAKAASALTDPVAFNTATLNEKMKGPLGAFLTKEHKTDVEAKEEFDRLFGEEGELKDAPSEYKDLAKQALKAKRAANRARDEATHAFYDRGSDITPENIGEDYSRRAHQLLMDIKEGKDPMVAEQEYRQYVRKEETAQHLRDVGMFLAQRRLDSINKLSPKTKLKAIKTFLDGLSRRGVDLRRGSVAADRNAQIAQDQFELQKVLIEEGLIDIFEGHSKNELEHMPKAFRDAYQGEKRIDASNQFVMDLMYRSRTGETPNHWKGEHQASFDRVWQAWDNATKSQMVQLNELGSGIELRKGHSNIAQRWDNQTILHMGFEEFRTRFEEMVDWEATARAHGGVMTGEKNEFGFTTKWEKFDREEFIKAFYAEATSPVKATDHYSSDIARGFGKSRQVIIKEPYEAQAMLTFSGHDSLGRLFLDQLRFRSEQIAVARNLGNKPLETVDNLLQRHGITKQVNTTRTKDGSFLDKLALYTGFAQKVHELDFNHTISEAKMLTGALDNPASLEWSYWGKTVRSLSHILYLPLSGVSAISDVALTLYTLNQMGMNTNTAQIAGALRKSASRRFHGDQRKLDNWYRGSGAAFDAMLNAGARRMAIQEGGPHNLINKTAEAMFSFNGLNLWTRMMQEAYVDILTQNLGRMARTGDWDKHTLLTLEGFGIKGDDLKLLQSLVENVDGKDRLGVPSLKDHPELQRKMLQYFSHFRDEAVMVPDVSTQAAVRFGSQAGTIHGEAIRTLMQYQSFPLAMNRITARKFLVNSRGDSAINSGQVTMGNMMTFMATMLTLSYLATAVKDMARGREPMLPWDMSLTTFGRVFNQSGIGGMVQSMLESGTGEPTAVMAPLPRMLWDMTMGSEGISDTIYQGRALYGANLPLVGPMITTVLGNLFPDTLGAHFRASQFFLEQEYGTASILPIRE